MDKQLFVHLQAGRKVSGKLRGYDVFLNVVLDDAVDETNPADKQQIGNVVRLTAFSALGARSLIIFSIRP